MSPFQFKITVTQVIKPNALIPFLQAVTFVAVRLRPVTSKKVNVFFEVALFTTSRCPKIANRSRPSRLSSSFGVVTIGTLDFSVLSRQTVSSCCMIKVFGIKDDGVKFATFVVGVTVFAIFKL
jgi:hypothetical protein